MPSPRDFDFWLGAWSVGEGDRGRNVVTHTFGGFVVEERFDGRPGTELQGMSVTVYDEHRGLWRQTWVDDTGCYFALEGGPVDDELHLLCRTHNAPEAGTVYRLRFFDIARDSLSPGPGSDRSTARRASTSCGASATTEPERLARRGIRPGDCYPGGELERVRFARLRLP